MNITIEIVKAWKSGASNISSEVIRGFFMMLCDAYSDLHNEYSQTLRMHENLSKQYRQMRDRISELENTIKQLTEEREKLIQMHFGKNSEKESVIMPQKEQKPEETSADEAGNEQVAVPDSDASCCQEKSVSEKKRKPAKPRKKTETWKEKNRHLPVLTTYQYSTGELCNLYGPNWYLSHYEEHVRIGVIPAVYYKEVVMTPVLRIADELVRLPVKDEVLPGTNLTAELGTQLVMEKYGYGMPLHRSLSRLSDCGVSLNCQTMNIYQMRIAEELFSVVVYYLMEELKKQKYIQCDETPYTVLCGKNGEYEKGWIWCVSSSELYKGHRIVSYHYDPSRSAAVIKKILGDDFKGIVISDAYSAYKHLAKVLDEIESSGCMMHARRYFVKALRIKISSLGEQKASSSQLENSAEARIIYKIAEIYDLDNQARSASDAERIRIRETQILPLMDELFEMIRKSQKAAKTNSESMNKAIRYALNNEAELRMFLEDATVPIDNGYCERSIRRVAVGRKSWDFFGSIRGAKAAAVIYTVIETARANGVKPNCYVEYLLRKVPQILDCSCRDKSVGEELMPWSESYKEFERQFEKRVYPLNQLVYPDGREDEQLSWFPKVMTEKPEMKKADRLKACAQIELSA